MNDTIDLFNEEDYDTDAIKEDSSHNAENSFIYSFLRGSNKYRIIKGFIDDVNLHSYTFSSGIKFTYHDDPAFYDPTIYVKPKYASLKDEMLHNKTCSIKQYQFVVLLHKVNQYIPTESIKKLRKLGGIPLLPDHLLSVCLYCCCTELCTKFSATYRKNKWNETLDSLLNRHSEFANMGRFLMELVHAYGTETEGSFYCGISCKMVVPEFRTMLKGPTSTSKTVEVAQSFGTVDGMVIQFKSIKNVGGVINSFGCGWISDYASEDEYLFLENVNAEGWSGMQIETVIFQGNSLNFKQFFGALFSFQCTLIGWGSDAKLVKIGQKDIDILNDLIDYQLGIKINKTYPKYIHQTFHVFTSKFVKIKLRCDWNRLKNQRLRELILMNADDNEDRNMLSGRIIKLFPSLKEIKIYTAIGIVGRDDVYEFNLLSFLDQISGSSSLFSKNRLTITIKNYDEWKENLLTMDIKQHYQQKGLIIEESNGRQWNSRLIIKKI